jgi:hypothetical protein
MLEFVAHQVQMCHEKVLVGSAFFQFLVQFYMTDSVMSQKRLASVTGRKRPIYHDAQLSNPWHSV